MRNIYLKEKDYHVLEFDNLKYIFFSESLQLYKLDNPYIIEYINTINDKSYKSYLTKAQINEIYDFINEKLNNNPSPIYAEGDRNINSIILNISGIKCNLNCNYCFAFADKQYIMNKMDLNIAKKAIDFLISINPKAKYYNIVLFGGEPFINYNLICEINSYCEEIITNKLKKYFSLAATTNGTILNKKLLDVFKKVNSSIYISLDGPEIIHNKNRPYHNGKGSFKKIMSNIELLKKYNINHSFRPTITSDCNNLLEIVTFFEKLETEFSFEFTIKSKYKNYEFNEYTDKQIHNIYLQYYDIIEFYLTKIQRNETIYCNNIISALNRIHFRQAKGYVCTAGRNILTVNSDSTLYTCQTISNIFNANIGTLDKGINKKKLKKFISPQVNLINLCKNCWIRYLCSGHCFAEKYIENNDIFMPIKVKCDLKKMQWEQYLFLYQKIRSTKPDYFENIRRIDTI